MRNNIRKQNCILKNTQSFKRKKKLIHSAYCGMQTKFSNAFLSTKAFVSIWNSLKFVSMAAVNSKLALVQVMALSRTCGKSLPRTMTYYIDTHLHDVLEAFSRCVKSVELVVVVVCASVIFIVVATTSITTITLLDHSFLCVLNQQTQEPLENLVKRFSIKDPILFANISLTR